MNTQAQMLALAAAMGTGAIDEQDGEWMVEAVRTAETLADFEQASKQHWAECSAKMEGTIAGLPFVAWSRVQVRKGATRRPLAVIDFGDFRMAINDDASDWGEINA